MRTSSLLVFLLLGTAAGLQGQESLSRPAGTAAATQQSVAAKPVAPGGIATVVVTLQAPSSATVDSIRYHIDGADSVRLFAPASGVAPVLKGTARLPLTFGVPASASAGLLIAGRVVADWGGTRTERAFAVVVKARYAIRFRLGNEALTVSPGAPVTLNYHLDNRGNAIDTAVVDVRPPLGWRSVVLPDRVVLAPGDTASGAIQLVAGPTATPGAERVIAVAVVSHEGRDTRSATLTVVSPENWFGDLQSVPSTLFVGSSTAGGTGPGVALHAAGPLTRDTRLDLAYRYRQQPFAPPAFQRELAGPELHVGIERPDWGVRLGDVFTPSNAFTGPSLHGRGLDANWTDSTHTAALSIAQPSTFGLRPEQGHIVRASAGVKTGVGSFAAKVVDYRRSDAYFEGYGATAGGVQYDYHDGDQRLSVLAGLMRIRSDSAGSATGPTLDVDYQILGRHGTLNARVRKVPAAVVRTAAYGNQLLLSGNHVVVDALSALAWGYLNQADVLGAPAPALSRGGALGLRYRFGRGGQLQLTSNYRDSKSTSSDGFTVRSLYRTVDAAFHMPIGSVTAEVDGEFGTTENYLAGTSPYRFVTSGLHWSHGGEWLWLGTSYQDIGLGKPFLYLDLSGAFHAGPVQVQAGLSGRIDHVALADAVGLWSGTTVSLNRTLDITVGIDYQPTTVAERWRLSLGFARKFDLPLPVHKPAAVDGVVFEDRNGNRVRDDDEPPLPGVTVRFGPLSTVTDEQGRFRFVDPVQGGNLRIETGDLPLGLHVPRDVHLPSAGNVDIPVVHTATLDVSVFVDANANGQRDPVEQPDTNAVVSLVGPAGHTRDVAVDDTGHAGFTGIDPGQYTLVVHPSPTPRGSAPAVSRDIIIRSGDTLRENVAVPLRQREIRMPGGGTLQPAHDNTRPAVPRAP